MSLEIFHLGKKWKGRDVSALCGNPIADGL